MRLPAGVASKGTAFGRTSYQFANGRPLKLFAGRFNILQTSSKLKDGHISLGLIFCIPWKGPNDGVSSCNDRLYKALLITRVHWRKL